MSLLVLYGSQTGTAEQFAQVVAIFARAHGLKPKVLAMDSVNLETLQVYDGSVVFLCSTYGVGEFPRNAQRFWTLLNAEGCRLPSSLKYAIFGLGNSTNVFFCKAALDLDERLSAIGATRTCNTCTSCELAQGGHETAFRRWLTGLWSTLLAGEAEVKFASIYKVEKVPDRLKDATANWFECCAASTSTSLGNPTGFVAFTVVASDTVNSGTPSAEDRPARLMRLKSAEATPAKWGEYNLMDHFEVLPKNDPSLVARVLERCGIPDPDHLVKVEALDEQDFSAVHHMTIATPRELLTKAVDLNGLPSRSALEMLAMCSASRADADALTSMAMDMTPSSSYEENLKRTWTLADLLDEYPSIKPDLGQLLTLLPRIVPRTYSIASDPAKTKDLEFVYALERRDLGNGRLFLGLATNYLHSLEPGSTVLGRVTQGIIKAPPVEAPFFGVALGTGIGVFRALLQQRAAAKAKQRTVGQCYIFYGYRKATVDFYFKKELADFEVAGVLDLRTVGSLDQASYLTPIDLIEQQPHIVVQTINGSSEVPGYFIYCGIGGSVPGKVQAAVAAAAGKTGADESVFIPSLRRAARFLEEHHTPDLDFENVFKGSPNLQKPIMFCMQCEQTKDGTGCSKAGVCGKTSSTSAYQDMVIQALKLASYYAHSLRRLDKLHPGKLGTDLVEHTAFNRFTLESLFATLTNVNFDNARFEKILNEADVFADELNASYAIGCKTVGEKFSTPKALAVPGAAERAARSNDIEDLASDIGVAARWLPESKNKSAVGVCEMLTYGLKGVAAYAAHSLVAGNENKIIYEFVHEALAFLISPERNDLGAALQMCLRCGEVNASTMELLYKTNSSLGVPEPTTVVVGPAAGTHKAILVSGHDLIVLHELEKFIVAGGEARQNIKIYTHGEMLPAHSYPSLKKLGVLGGHYGGAWMRQGVEFPHFPGPILMTTNCLTIPKPSYADHIYTVGAVGWPGVPHLGEMENNECRIDFETLIKRAGEMSGFTAGETRFGYDFEAGVTPPHGHTLVVGFGHEAILGAAPTILKGIEAGLITRFHVVGGCDGFETQRSYYTDLVRGLPQTDVVLTVGCGKFRINGLDMGTIGDTGIPRLLDMGQCNDSWSSVQVALGLANALNCKVSDLPLSITLSWFEQKAIAVLLTCLALGLKPIRIGPKLPAFITPEVLAVLVKDFGVTPIGVPKDDVAKLSAAKAMA